MHEDSFSPAREQAFVARVIIRDTTALEELGRRLRCIPRFLASIDRRAGRRLGSEELEDLAQNVTLTVLRRIDEFRAHAPLEAWVHRFCLLSYMNAIRSARRQAERSVPFDSVSSQVDDARLADLERRERIEHALERLGGLEAEIVRLRHYEGLEFDLIGERMDVKPATVKTRYYRGMKRLRAFLEGGENADD